MRISDWSSDVCSSDLGGDHLRLGLFGLRDRLLDARLGFGELRFGAGRVDYRKQPPRLDMALVEIGERLQRAPQGRHQPDAVGRTRARRGTSVAVRRDVGGEVEDDKKNSKKSNNKG